MAGKDDYVRGKMDIREQEQTFGVFWALTKWGLAFCVAAVILLAIFRTGG